MYERQPNDPSPNSPPKLWRVLQFSGSKRLLNNRDSSVTDPLCQNLGSGSKGQENRFLIKGFSLDADREFEKCVAIQEYYSMPPWDGDRDIRQLKVFHVNFCRQGYEFADASLLKYQRRLRNEGRRFCTLKQGSIRYYDGSAIHEDRTIWEVSLSSPIAFRQPWLILRTPIPLGGHY